MGNLRLKKRSRFTEAFDSGRTSFKRRSALRVLRPIILFMRILNESTISALSCAGIVECAVEG